MSEILPDIRAGPILLNFSPEYIELDLSVFLELLSALF